MEYLEMLAKLGIGNAHPGGFAATLAQLQQYPIPAGSRVLEVGCGTGRTACYLAKQGYSVTGVDIRQDMIDKANQRARLERAPVQFVQADVRRLPFQAGSFDVVLAESVTIFTDQRAAMREYHRVLGKGGRLFDREIVALRPLDTKVRALMNELYGFDQLLQLGQWAPIMREAGFSHAVVTEPQRFPEHPVQDELLHPDPVTLADQDAIHDPKLWETAEKYHQLMREYGDHFGFALLIGTA